MDGAAHGCAEFEERLIVLAVVSMARILWVLNR